MLIIPELETVVLQPPRTGSTSLRDAVLSRYPLAFTPYRHMERDGIPIGYDRWKTICIVRHPADRLASLYRYMKRFSSTTSIASEAWMRRMSEDVDRPFSEWLWESKEIFTDPVDHDGTFIPRYAVRHPMPITRKSLWFWARPDLGPVDLLKLEDTPVIEARLGVFMERSNASKECAAIEACTSVAEFLAHRHDWDLSLYAD